MISYYTKYYGVPSSPDSNWPFANIFMFINATFQNDIAGKMLKDLKSVSAFSNVSVGTKIIFTLSVRYDVHTVSISNCPAYKSYKDLYWDDLEILVDFGLYNGSSVVKNYKTAWGGYTQTTCPDFTFTYTVTDDDVIKQTNPIPPLRTAYDWVSWAKKEQAKLDYMDKGKELYFLDTSGNVTGQKAIIVGGTLGFMVSGAKYTLKDIISGRLSPSSLGKTFSEGMAKCTGLYYLITGIWNGLTWATIGGYFLVAGSIFLAIKSMLDPASTGWKDYPFKNLGLTPNGYCPGQSGINDPFLLVTPKIPNSAAGNGDWIPTTTGGTVGTGTTEEGIKKPVTEQEALEKQARQYQAMGDFLLAESQVGKNWSSYYDKAKDVIGFDSKLRGYEASNLDNIKAKDTADLKISQGRAKYIETESGIYVNGERVPASITPEGIVMGTTRIPYTVTKDSIVAIGTGGTSTGTVTGEVSLKSGSEVNINAEQLAQVIAQNPIKVNTQDLATALSKAIEFNTNPLVDFATKEGIILNPKLIEGKSIDLRVPEGTQVNGNINVHFNEVPEFKAKLEDTTLKLEETSLDKLTAKMDEIDKKKEDIRTLDKQLKQNAVNNIDRDNTIAENKKVISSVEKGKASLSINGRNAVEHYEHQQKTLYDDTTSPQIALGQEIEMPKGLVTGLANSYLPSVLLELQQGAITKNLVDEHQPDDESLSLGSDILKTFFFDVDKTIKEEVKILHKEELEQILSIIPPIGSLSKIIDFMKLGGN